MKTVTTLKRDIDMTPATKQPTLATRLHNILAITLLLLVVSISDMVSQSRVILQPFTAFNSTNTVNMTVGQTLSAGNSWFSLSQRCRTGARITWTITSSDPNLTISNLSIIAGDNTALTANQQVITPTTSGNACLSLDHNNLCFAILPRRTSYLRFSYDVTANNGTPTGSNQNVTISVSIDQNDLDISTGCPTIGPPPNVSSSNQNIVVSRNFYIARNAFITSLNPVINFGFVVPGQSKAIQPQSGMHFSLGGEQGSSVQVSAPLSVTLQQTGGSDTIIFRRSTIRFNSSTNVANAPTFPTNPFFVTNATNFPALFPPLLSGPGANLSRIDLWIGGNVSPILGKSPGAYTGIYVISLSNYTF